MALTNMKSSMDEEDGSRAGADTNMPADVADKSRKNPAERLSYANVQWDREWCVAEDE